MPGALLVQFFARTPVTAGKAPAGGGQTLPATAGLQAKCVAILRTTRTKSRQRLPARKQNARPAHADRAFARRLTQLPPGLARSFGAVPNFTTPNI